MSKNTKNVLTIILILVILASILFGIGFGITNYYVITKLRGNIIKRTDADRIEWFEVRITDGQFNEEKYIVVIEYNLDTHFFAKMDRTFNYGNSNGKTFINYFGEQHIEWWKVYEE